MLAAQEKEGQLCEWTHLPVDLTSARPIQIVLKVKGLHQHLKNGTRLLYLVLSKCLDPTGSDKFQVHFPVSVWKSELFYSQSVGFL